MVNRKEGMRCFETTGLYGITASQKSLGRSNETVVREMLDNGIRVIQYREKEKTGRERYEECLKLRRMASDYKAVFIVDDFVDLAMAVDADGVHIGQEDLPARVVRTLLGPEKIIGLSTHSPEEYENACALGEIIDYIGVGPVYPTQTKPTAQPVGLKYVQYANERNAIPFVAIGGIKAYNINEVLHAGAKTISVVTDITESKDISGTIETYQEIIKKTRQVTV